LNLLEVYIKETHSVEPCKEAWMEKFPEFEFVKVDATTQCYGREQRSTHVWNTAEWAKIKEQGYYMG
jgi:hypothetical protein